MSRAEPLPAGAAHSDRIPALIARTTAAIMKSHERIERAKTLTASARGVVAASQKLFSSNGHTASAVATLRKVRARFLRGYDLQRLFDDTLAAVLTAVRTDHGNVQMMDWRTRSLRIVAQQGFDEEFLEFFANVRAEGTCGMAMRLGQRVIVPDVTIHPIFSGRPALDVMLRAKARAVQSTPIVTSSGTVLGMISTHFPVPHRPFDEELRTVELFARNLATLIEPGLQAAR